MFEDRRQYHPTSILSPVPYPLSEPPMPTSSSTASLTSFLRTTSPHSSMYHRAEMADEGLAFNHAHAMPLSAAPPASHSSAGLPNVSSTTSLSSLGSSSSSLSHMPSAARTSASASGRPSDVDYELFDIFQMASSFEGAGESSQLFRHSIPASTDPLASAHPLSPTSSLPHLSPQRPSQLAPSGLASQHLQDAMLRHLTGADRAAFLNLSPLPSSGSALTPPPVTPLQPSMSVHDEAAVKREMMSPTRDIAGNRPAGLSPLSPPMASSRNSGSSTPSSSASFQPGAPSHFSPASSPSGPISPYAQLPPALLHQLLTQQHMPLSYPGSSAASHPPPAPAAHPSFMSYPLPSSPSGVPLAPHSHSTMQEDEEDDEDDEENDESDIPRAHKRTHLASPSSHVSTLPHRSHLTRSADAPSQTSEEKEREVKGEREQEAADTHPDPDGHKDTTADQANPSSSSSPLSSSATHNSRLSRKAELARASRKRKKMYVADLEEKVSKLAATVEELQVKLKKNAGGLSKEERIRREQQSAIKERLTQLIAQTQATEPSVADAAPDEDAAASVEASAAAEQPMSATSTASPSPTAAPTPTPVQVPRASYELQELVTRFVYNCLTLDMQILTEHGFLSVDDVVVHLQQYPSLHIACYNADSATTEYHPIELQHVTRPPASWQRIVRFQSAEADVDVCVTDNHDMWVRNSSEPFGKVQAGELLTGDDEGDCTQLLTCAERGVWRGREYTWSEQPFVRLLGVRTRSEHDALLELFGCWLGCGCVCDEDEECVVLLAADDSHSRYLDKLLASLHDILSSVVQQRNVAGNRTRRYGVYSSRWFKLFGLLSLDHPHSLHSADDTASDNDSDSASDAEFSPHFSISPLYPASPSSPLSDDATPRSLAQHSRQLQFSRWLLDTLGSQQLRTVIQGVSNGRSVEMVDKQAMYTDSIALRDQLQLLALHAGYTSHFTLADRTARWRISYSDTAAVTQPTLHPTSDITAVIDHCPVWCVTVPQKHQLIWARRVLTISRAGAVVSASRPVITGNSRERQGHVDYYFDRVAHCLSPGLQVRFAMWGLTQSDEFYSAPGLWQSLMEGEIGLDTAQMSWILSKREAIHAERKNLQTCELMLRETRNAISMHLHSLHGHMDDLLSVMTPLQLAKFYLWVENNAWCMQMIPGLGG